MSLSKAYVIIQINTPKSIHRALLGCSVEEGRDVKLCPFFCSYPRAVEFLPSQTLLSRKAILSARRKYPLAFQYTAPSRCSPPRRRTTFFSKEILQFMASLQMLPWDFRLPTSGEKHFSKFHYVIAMFVNVIQFLNICTFSLHRCRVYYRPPWTEIRMPSWNTQPSIEQNGGNFHDRNSRTQRYPYVVVTDNKISTWSSEWKNTQKTVTFCGKLIRNSSRVFYQNIAMLWPAQDRGRI